METQPEIDENNFPKNEVSQEEGKEGNEGKEENQQVNQKEDEKEKQEEEKSPLSVKENELFELNSEIIKKACGDKVARNINKIYIIFFVLLILSVFLYFFFKFKREYTELTNVNNQTPIKISELEKNIVENQTIINNNSTETSSQIINNETNITNNDNKINYLIANDSNISNESFVSNVPNIPNANQTKNILTKNKNTIGFLSSTITPFMVSMGEYFIKTNNYDVVFLTKSPSPKDLQYNNNIKRINAYNNHILIQNACKNENINYLIVNDDVSSNEIKWMKSLEIKIIGILDDLQIQKKKKRNLISKNSELYDAFIQGTPEDYIHMKNSKRNIYIPIIYSQKSKPSNLKNSNIILRTELNDKKNGLISIINSLPLIIKEVPNTKLNIISSDKPTKAINELIKKLNLKANINFILLNEQYLNYYTTSSLFIYGSLNEICPKILNEAKAYGLPCIVSSTATNINLNSGIIKVDISNSNILAKEIIKLLKDNVYRKKMESEAKSSLEKSNNETLQLWEKLFISLQAGENNFQKLRKEIEGNYSKIDLSKKKN